MLSEEETASIKEQLFKQIETFPEEQREAAREQVQAMNSEQLEDFLERNKMIKKDNEKCLFCSIADGEVFSYKIGENKEAVAVLDINPVSKAHSLVLPKEHKPIEEVPSSLQLAQEIGKKIKAKLNPENVKIETTAVQGHGLINIIPVYKGEKLERKKAEEEDLQKLQKELLAEEKKEEPKEPPKKKAQLSDLPKAPRRVP